MSKTIHISKKGGQVQDKEYFLRALDANLALLRNGEYDVTIARSVKQRTNPQNRTMWMYFRCIESETGTDKQDVHDYYCTKFLQRTVVINGIEQIAAGKSAVEKTIVGGTSGLNTLQFNDFLEKVQADAATEFGITLPNPDDLHFAALEEYCRTIV